MTGLACALCARANPLTPQHLAVTQVGSLLVCGGHVDEAFEMNAARMLRPEYLEAVADRIAKVTEEMPASAPHNPTPAPTPVSAATDTNLRERLHEAISDSWSTMPTCWEAQTNAVMAALPGDLLGRVSGPVEEIAWDLRELIGPQLEEAQVRDADGVAALVADIVSPVLERLRAELDAAQATTEALAAGRGRSVLDRVSDWAESALDSPVSAATEAHGGAGEAQEGSR